ncbi:MAG: imidazole glycerol phosphate synthase subunit HisF [Alphaproteobacteria bacterium]|nr:imidazole glycerol phosphate synthase subunit HisF [Alphaproteobacteria bacterium]
MLRPRIIPCLLVRDSGLVKTRQFGDPKYVGDPLNAVRIFNEKEVDELTVLDIDATARRREPDYTMIRNLAGECRMPLCYGGGVSTADQIEKIITLGVEKVAFSAAAAGNPDLISEGARRVGAQSIVVVLDVRKTGLLRRQEIFIHNGTRKTGLNPVEFARRAQELGAGEIVVNSIEHDGMMNGYDLPLIRDIRAAVTLPLTVMGGAGSHGDIAGLIREFGTIGAAAGSLFVFKGKYRAVLINYPTPSEKAALLRAATG